MDNPHRPRLIAITREVPLDITQCALTHIGRQPIDVASAARQHASYESLLRDLGVEVISLPPQDHMPDSVFVEDTVVVLDEVAIIARPKLTSRQVEIESVEAALRAYRPVERILDEGRLEGGDVLRIGQTLYVGCSSRTNQEGIKQLARLVERFGYAVVPVEVTGCLHLKSACSFVGNRTVLANSSWINVTPFHEMEIVEVPTDEPFAGNTLRVGDVIVMPANLEKTHRLLEKRGLEVRTVDVGELQKAEGGVTCCSLVFTVADAQEKVA